MADLTFVRSQAVVSWNMASSNQVNIAQAMLLVAAVKNTTTCTSFTSFLFFWGTLRKKTGFVDWSRFFFYFSVDHFFE